MMKLKLSLRLCACACVCVSVLISAACCSHLLSHEIQSALQGVGDFNLAIAVVDLHASGTETFQREKLINQNKPRSIAAVFLP